MNRADPCAGEDATPAFLPSTTTNPHVERSEEIQASCMERRGHRHSRGRQRSHHLRHGTGQLLSAIWTLMKDFADKASAGDNPEAAAELIMAIFATAMTMKSMVMTDEEKSHRILGWKDQLMASIKRKRRMDQSSSNA